MNKKILKSIFMLNYMLQLLQYRISCTAQVVAASGTISAYKYNLASSMADSVKQIRFTINGSNAAAWKSRCIWTVLLIQVLQQLVQVADGMKIKLLQQRTL